MHSALSNLSAAELVGKGIAPVKREYWKPPASRQEVAAVGSSEAAATAAPLERKSKRQAKRVSTKRAVHLLLLQTLLLCCCCCCCCFGQPEATAAIDCGLRKPFTQERETGVNLCINFLAGNCEFDKDCRFSHDIQAYLAQKPRELPGQCPFSTAVRCPYGTHPHYKPLATQLAMHGTILPCCCKRSATGSLSPQTNFSNAA